MIDRARSCLFVLVRARSCSFVLPLLHPSADLRIFLFYAEVVELVDAHVSGACEGNLMRVRVPSSARFKAKRKVVEIR